VILNNYSDSQLRLAARLYYLDGLAQAEVAKFVKVSQAQVSRLLALARERGLVQISVAEYEPRNSALEKQLQERFDFSSVVVIKTIEGLSPEDLRRTVAHFAGPLIAPLIPRDSIVAVAGGRTMREVAQWLPEEKEHRLTIVQAMGNIDSNLVPADASELGRMIAHRRGGSLVTLNTPAFVPDKKTRDAFLALEQIRSVAQQLNKADVALIGVGTLDNSVFVERGVLSAENLEKLKRDGAVGEICGRFFDKNGRECDSPWRDRIISIELEQLRKIPQVIGVVAGNDRSLAIAAAVRGGLLKSLVIDEGGAAALLEQNQPSPRSSKPKNKK
jgi:deoxyribonucleoside regulator